MTRALQASKGSDELHVSVVFIFFLHNKLSDHLVKLQHNAIRLVGSHLLLEPWKGLSATVGNSFVVREQV